MADNVMDAGAGYQVSSVSKRRIHSGVDFTVGAAGVISATDSDDPKWSTGTFAAGLSSLVFPKCPKGRLIPVIKKSAAATVTEIIFTAFDMTAGTATIRTSKAGVATNPASGDIIGIYLDAQGEP